VAELLVKYGLRGTFYVPKTAERGTMTDVQVRELNRTFEVGGHTLHHTVLTGVTDQQAEQEIVGCKSWLEDCTGRPCPTFCPPRGRYAARHLKLIRRAGFRGVRNVELLSIDFPRSRAGLLLLPTTVQAHSHRLGAYARNLARRAAVRNLWLFLHHGRTTDWLRLTRSLLTEIMHRGGVFHLWGHSWEIEANGQWLRLEAALRLLGAFARQAPALTNGHLCEAVVKGQKSEVRSREKQAMLTSDLDT
jgi:hypothetical protein